MGSTYGEHCEDITNPDSLHKMQSKERGERALQNDLLGPGPPPGFWHGMVAQGASHARHDGSKQSAEEIIGLVVKRSPIYLQIQEELLAGKAHSQTAAAQALIEDLQRKVEELEANLEQVNRQNAELKEEISRSQAALENAQRQLVRLLSGDWGGSGGKPGVGTGVNRGGEGADRDRERGGNGGKPAGGGGGPKPRPGSKPGLKPTPTPTPTTPTPTPRRKRWKRWFWRGGTYAL